MYPYKNKSLDTCYDSSPQFMDLHAPLVSIGSPYNINHVAMDYNLDSIGISFDSILTNQNFANPTFADWKSGFSTGSPFPGSNQDSKNTAVSLDSLSGHISGSIFSTGSIGEDYAYSMRVDAFREGIKIASVWRDAVFSTKAADTLNVGRLNELPVMKIKGVKTNNYHITAYVGDTINIPIELLDSNTYLKDPNDTITSKQYISLRPEGFLFSNDFDDPNDCRVRGVEPCALIDPNPMRNIRSSELEFIAQDSLKSYFTWILTCKAISYYEKSKLHTFNFLYMDDYCEPEISFASLSVDVKMRVLEIVRNGNVLSVKNPSDIKWYLNDSLIYKDSSSIKIVGPGKYSVSARNYCYKGFYTVFPVGFDEKQWMSDVNIYPNPFNQKFTVELSADISKEAKLTLRDISGRQIDIKSDFQDNGILITASEELPSGVYFLNISVGENSSNRKIIKI